VVSFTARPIYPNAKNIWYLLARSLDGPRSGSEYSVRKSDLQPSQTAQEHHIKHSNLIVLYLLRIRKVTGSNIGAVTEYLDCGLLYFKSVRLVKLRDIILSRVYGCVTNNNGFRIG
jgi:hypothetical protein